MGLARLSYRVGPPASLFVTALLVSAAMPAQPSVRAAGPPRVDCRSLAASDAARSALTLSTGALPSLAVRPQLGARGELLGRTFTVQSGSAAPLAIELPVESSVGLTAGDLVIYTRHTTASGSEVRALNPLTRCDVRLAAPVDIVRSAVLDRTAGSLYVHAVRAAGRGDGGIVRYDLASGDAAVVMPALAASDAIGPIFGTGLRWSMDGRELAVQSCGFSQCLTRVLDTASGRITSHEAAGQGALIALTADHLVTYAACHGLPCAVLSSDRAAGSVTLLVDEAFDVSARASSGGSAALRITTAAGSVEVTQ